MNRYRELREELKLTQVQLASILGCGQAGVSGRESGKKEPRSREPLMALLWLKTLPRERLDALLADPSNLED